MQETHAPEPAHHDLSGVGVHADLVRIVHAHREVEEILLVRIRDLMRDASPGRARDAVARTDVAERVELAKHAFGPMRIPQRFADLGGSEHRIHQ
ncbi:MAG: hypothetical protein ACHREM_22580 [Polyangiales bacterium]